MRAMAGPAGNAVLAAKVVVIEVLDHLEHFAGGLLLRLVVFVPFAGYVAVSALHAQQPCKSIHHREHANRRHALEHLNVLEDVLGQGLVFRGGSGRANEQQAEHDSHCAQCGCLPAGGSIPWALRPMSPSSVPGKHDNITRPVLRAPGRLAAVFFLKAGPIVRARDLLLPDACLLRIYQCGQRQGPFAAPRPWLVNVATTMPWLDRDRAFLRIKML